MNVAEAARSCLVTYAHGRDEFAGYRFESEQCIADQYPQLVCTWTNGKTGKDLEFYRFRVDLGFLVRSNASMDLNHGIEELIDHVRVGMKWRGATRYMVLGDYKMRRPWSRRRPRARLPGSRPEP